MLKVRKAIGYFHLALGEGPNLVASKYGVLTGSFVAGVTGYVLLRMFTKAPTRETA